jgi:hypothetical protein
MSMSVSATEVAAACRMLREFKRLMPDHDYLAALLEAQQAEIERLHEVLTWINRRGGLGVEVHEHIAAALAAPAKAGNG